MYVKLLDLKSSVEDKVDKVIIVSLCQVLNLS